MVKRPVIYVLMAYITGVLLPKNILYDFLIFMMLIILSYYVYQKATHRSCYIFIMPLMFVLGFANANYNMSENYKHCESVNEGDCIIKGRIDSYSFKENSIAIIIKDSDLKENIIVYADKNKDLNFEPGDYLKVNGSLSAFKHSNNPGQFDEYNYYVSQQHIYGRMYAEEIEVIKYTKWYDLKYSIKRKLYKLKYTSLEIIQNVYKENAPIVSAMILGEKSLIDKDIKELYMKNGIMHVLAISGLHISIIGYSLYNFMLKKGINLYYASGISILIIILYGMMTDFSISTSRAVVMMITFIIARCIGKTYDMINILCISALFMLMRNPLSLYSSGFLMSYMSVLSAATVTPLFELYLIKQKGQFSKISDHIRIALLTGISISILGLPVILSCYYEVSLLSYVLNCIIIPLMALIVGMSVVTLIAGLLIIGFNVITGLSITITPCYLCGGCVYYLLKMIEYILRLADKLSFLRITTGKPLKIFIIIYYLFVFAFIITGYFKSRKSLYICKEYPYKRVIMVYKYIRELKINPAIWLL
ncbi:MAG: ComEC family competence protein, partial [Lachnospiraceae bacterium]|nr:ComEC family competence protein [Lachnospiraceae bacterium]